MVDGYHYLAGYGQSIRTADNQDRIGLVVLPTPGPDLIQITKGKAGISSSPEQSSYKLPINDLERPM